MKGIEQLLQDLVRLTNCAMPSRSCRPRATAPWPGARRHVICWRPTRSSCARTCCAHCDPRLLPTTATPVRRCGRAFFVAFGAAHQDRGPALPLFRMQNARQSRLAGGGLLTAAGGQPVRSVIRSRMRAMTLSIQKPLVLLTTMIAAMHRSHAPTRSACRVG